jgi:hypothetical protein
MTIVRSQETLKVQSMLKHEKIISNIKILRSSVDRLEDIKNKILGNDCVDVPIPEESYPTTLVMVLDTLPDSLLVEADKIEKLCNELEAILFTGKSE